MERQTIMRSPAGPLGWELRLGEPEAQYPDLMGLNGPSPNLPEVRFMPSLPVSRESEAWHLVRGGRFRALLNGRRFV